MLNRRFFAKKQRKHVLTLASQVETFEQRLVLTANAYEIYAWSVVNLMRENPSRFADQLEGMYKNTLSSAHGYSKTDAVWTDIRQTINNGKYKEHFTQALALMRAQPNLGPLAWEDSLEQRAVDHNAWMETHCYAHSGSDPECFGELPGFDQPGIQGDPDTVSAADLGSWSNGAWAENIGYSSGNSMSATRSQFGNTSNAYYQRAAYADIIGFMVEVNSKSLGHLKNLLARDRASSGGLSLAAKNKEFSQLNAFGIDYNFRNQFGSNQTNKVVTHSLSQNKNSGGYITGLAYEDRNNNGFYDVGEGVNVDWQVCYSTNGLTICESWLTTASTGRDHGAIYEHMSNGVYEITAYSGGRTLGTRTVSVSNANVKIEFRVTNGFGLTGPNTTPTMVPDNFDALGSNNTSNTATFIGTVSPGNPFRDLTEVLSIHNSSDSDWFRFEVTDRNAQANIEVGFEDDDGDLDLKLYRVENGSNQLIASQTSTTDNESYAGELIPGTYLVNVYGYNGATNFYSISLDVESNPLPDTVGNTLATARSMNLGTNGVTSMSGSLEGSDVDMYRFTLTEQQRLSISTEIPASNIQVDSYLRLFNASGNQLAANDDFGSSPYARISEVTLPAGTYYVAVSGFEDQSYSPTTASGLTSQAVGDYNLTITHLRDDVAGWNSETGRWYIGGSNGTVFDQRTGPRWNPLTTWDMVRGDFNGDGYTDVAGRRDNGEWWVLDGLTQASNYWGKWGADAQQGWHAVQVGDFNGDGLDDIVGRNWRGEFYVSRSLGDGFTGTEFWGRVSQTGWLAHLVGDYNGDGLADIASFRQDGYWWVSESNGESLELDYYMKVASQAQANWQNFLSGDFNGDGLDDIIQQSRTAIGQWWIGYSNGSADGAFSLQFANRWDPNAFRDFHIGDVNGDGRDDLIARDSANQWWINRALPNGRMNTEYWGRWSADAQLETIVGDFDGDGRTDIAAVQTTTGNWYLQHSTGTRFNRLGFGHWNTFTGPNSLLVGELV